MSEPDWQCGGMKTKPVEEVTAGPVGGRPIKLRCDYREDDFEYWPRPTELQLAQLAAGLARTEKIEPRQLVAEAWALYWESCRVIKTDYKEVNDFLEHEAQGHEADEDDWEEGHERFAFPKRYPASFKEVELLLLPKLKGRMADRARIMRDFMFEDYVRSRRARMRDETGAEPKPFTPEELARMREESKAELDDLFGQLRSLTFNARHYERFAHYFLDWYEQRYGFIKRMVRAASARRGWEKRKNNKTAKTGARPKHEVLREILDPTGDPPLDGSKRRKKS